MTISGLAFPFHQCKHLFIIFLLVLVSDVASVRITLQPAAIQRAPLATQLAPAQSVLINPTPAESQQVPAAEQAATAGNDDDLQTLQGANTIAMAHVTGSTPKVRFDIVPIYHSADFLTSYLTNLSYPIIIEGKPWDYGSTNMVQYKLPGGGISYWDYWSEGEDWETVNHQWHDDQGNWHTYSKETIKDSAGKNVTAYVLFDRKGPGVMDKLWFTHDPTQAFLSILSQVNLFFSTDPPEVVEWGSLSKLGNLRIEVDNQIAYDGPIEAWFSGEAQGLPQKLAQVLVWRYRQFGSNGNIIPIPYQDRLKISVYGGVGKPKWFMATGETLPPGTRVKPYNGDDLPMDQMEPLAANVLNPETFLQTLPNSKSYQLTAQAGSPAALSIKGSGTVAALEIKLGKQYDPKQLSFRVRYGKTVGIQVPLLAFFSEPDHLSLHHSTPIGVVEADDEYLFYSNLPMPYQDGIDIEISAQGGNPIPFTLSLATLDTVYDTQLRVLYRTPERLALNGPDYGLNVDGDGKLVGLVLITQDQQYDKIPKIRSKETGQEDVNKRVWPMGYLEGNLVITDGAGNMRMYSGQEDWAEGGYYFNAGYTTPTGGSNRPFAGILRYKGGADGYATLFRYFNDLSAFRFKNGLQLALGHGTYNNNFPVTYSAVLFYYLQIPGTTPAKLPASDYTTIISTATNP